MPDVILFPDDNDPGKVRRVRDATLPLEFTGVVEGSYTAYVAIGAPVSVSSIPVLPTLESAPILLGEGKIGAPVTIDPGVWSGALVIELQWCRDGVEIAGATGPEYVPVSEDDLKALTCRVLAANAAGNAMAETSPLKITHVAPVAKGMLFDEVFDQFSGPQTVPTAQDFTGSALRFSVSGAAIDPDTGVVTVNTNSPRSEAVIVTAQNSGGQAQSSFWITVEAAETEGEGEPGTPADTVMASSVEIEDVRITFSEARPVGHFISGNLGLGDPFVIGPTTVTAWTPGPANLSGRDINGAMLNPIPTTSKVGFDGRASGVYDPAKNAGLSLPITLNPGDTLIIAKSNLLTGAGAPAGNGSHAVEKFVLLTCLAEVPFADSFRPQPTPNFDGSPKRIWRWSDVDTSLLGAVEPEPDFPTWASAESAYDRFLPDIVLGWEKYGVNAVLHTPTYGRDTAAAEAAGFMMVNCSGSTIEQKKRTLIGQIQRGIDRYSFFKDRLDRGAGIGVPEGGWNFARKFPIMFAGRLLGDVDMLNIDQRVTGSNTPEKLRDPFPSENRSRFAEDGHPVYVDQKIIDATNAPDWDPDYGDTSRPQGPFPQAAYGMPAYFGSGGNSAKQRRNMSAGVGYHAYQMIYGMSCSTYALAALMMGLRPQWRYEPFFDYIQWHIRITDGLPDPWQFQNGSEVKLYADLPGYDLEWRAASSGGPRAWDGVHITNAGPWVRSMLRNRYGAFNTRAPLNWIEPELISAGDLVVGDTVTCRRGCWVAWPLPTYILQWQRNSGSGWTDITGANAEDYVTQPADGGCTLRLKVTATNAEGFAEAFSAVTQQLPAAGAKPLDFTVEWAVSGTSNWGNDWAYDQQENDLGVALLRRPAVVGNPSGYVTDAASGPTIELLTPAGGQTPRVRDTCWFRGPTWALRGGAGNTAAANGSVRLVLRGTGPGGTGISTSNPISHLGEQTGFVTNGGSGANVTVPVNPSPMVGDGRSRLMIVVSRECESADTAQIVGTLNGFTFLVQSGSDRSRLAVYLSDDLLDVETLSASPGVLDLQTAVGNATNWRADYYEIRTILG
jgi:hypothetical protein